MEIEKTLDKLDQLIEVSMNYTKIIDENSGQTIGNKTYGILFWAYLFCPKNLDQELCLKLALTKYLNKCCSFNGLRGGLAVLRLSEALGTRDIYNAYDLVNGFEVSPELKFLKDITVIENIFHLYYLYMREKNKDKKEAYCERFKKSVLEGKELFFDKQYFTSIVETIKDYKDIIFIVEDFKKVKRNGYEQRGVLSEKGIFFADSDAEHSVTAMYLHWVLFGFSKMLIIHDLVEYKCGDITPIDFRKKRFTSKMKEEAEEKAIKEIVKASKNIIIEKIWREYSENKTTDSQKSKSSDKLDYFEKCRYLYGRGLLSIEELIDILEDYICSGVVKEKMILGVFQRHYERLKYAV